MKFSELLALFSQHMDLIDREVVVNTDTRSLKPKEVFLALKGENFDGHDFLKEAQAKGALLAIVSKKMPIDLPQMVVADTLQAYGEIARAQRLALNPTVMALTGSAGKTTTKNYLARICHHTAPTLATSANLNNEVGVPKTLLELKKGDKFAVIEMGANQRGEIARLTAIARPDVALITLVSAQHVEGFGSVDVIAQEKGTIYDGLREHGVAVLPCDDIYYAEWQRKVKHRQLSFGFSKEADVQLTVVSLSTKGGVGRLKTPQGEFEINTTLLGKHNLYNATAAATAALACNIPIECIQAGIAATKPEEKRMCVLTGYNQATLIDDCYNASPLGVMAALEVLASYPGEKIWVFGDMKELGEETDRQHEKVGQHAKELGIHHIFAIGEKSKLTLSAFGPQSRHFDSKDALISALKTHLDADTTVLIKGARSNHLETVVNALCID